jgi:hypothetical protein
VTASRRLPPLWKLMGGSRCLGATRGSDEPQGGDRSHQDNNRRNNGGEPARDNQATEAQKTAVTMAVAAIARPSGPRRVGCVS